MFLHHLFWCISGWAHPSLEFAWAQVAEGEHDHQELFHGQVGQEQNRHLQGDTHYKLMYGIDSFLDNA